MNIHYIYKIVNMISGKIYIGQTKRPNTRWSQHKSECKKDNPTMIINKSMKKYGLENFTFEVIASCCGLDAANESEELVINQENSIVPHGYNVAPGGCNLPKTENWKKLMSQKFKGRKCPYIPSKESKEKNKLSSLGRKKTKNNFLGVRPCYKKWKAEIKYNGKNIFIGSFASEIEAAQARDKKVYELYGEKAVLNFPLSESQ